MGSVLSDISSNDEDTGDDSNYGQSDFCELPQEPFILTDFDSLYLPVTPHLPMDLYHANSPCVTVTRGYNLY